jgi:hypothetical protein
MKFITSIAAIFDTAKGKRFALICNMAFCIPVVVSAVPVIVKWNNVKQEMDGFGCMGGYGDFDTWSPEQARMFCDTITGVGFSMFRFQMPNHHVVVRPPDYEEDGPVTSSIFKMAIQQIHQ